MWSYEQRHLSLWASSALHSVERILRAIAIMYMKKSNSRQRLPYLSRFLVIYSRSKPPSE